MLACPVGWVLGLGLDALLLLPVLMMLRGWMGVSSHAAQQLQELLLLLLNVHRGQDSFADGLRMVGTVAADRFVRRPIETGLDLGRSSR